MTCTHLRPLRSNNFRKTLLWLFCAATLLAFQSASFAAARRIVNLSTRANVGTGDNVVIAGIIIQGYGQATVVFRGIGPSLAPYFPAGTVLANPFLQLYDASGTLIWQNDNWQESQAAEISATGLAPSNSYESAIKMTLNPGTYTAVLSGIGGGTGMSLVEVYDITPQPNAIRLANISTRAHAENDYAKETLGVILQGSGNKSLLLRGLGPSLPLPGTLPNPFLALLNSSGGVIIWNEDWKTKWDGSSQQQQVISTGLAPANGYESAIPITLGPDAYTARLQDNTGATGIAVVEMYDLDPAPTPPSTTPTPTPTPPQRLLYYTDNGTGVYVGPPAEVWNTGQTPLQPLGPGTITVHFTGYAHQICQYGFCPPGGNPPLYAELWPELLNSSGVKIAEGQHLGLDGVDVHHSATVNFNWSGGPFKIRMMANSAHGYPNWDYVANIHLDVYAP